MTKSDEARRVADELWSYGFAERGVGDAKDVSILLRALAAEAMLLVAMEDVLMRSGWCLWYDDMLYQARREVAPLITDPSRFRAAYKALSPLRSAQNLSNTRPDTNPNPVTP